MGKLFKSDVEIQAEVAYRQQVTVVELAKQAAGAAAERLALRHRRSEEPKVTGGHNQGLHDEWQRSVAELQAAAQSTAERVTQEKGTLDRLRAEFAAVREGGQHGESL